MLGLSVGAGAGGGVLGLQFGIGGGGGVSSETVRSGRKSNRLQRFQVNIIVYVNRDYVATPHNCPVKLEILSPKILEILKILQISRTSCNGVDE